MGEKKKSGFLGKIFGGNKKESCCSVQFEEVPENESVPEEKEDGKKPGNKEKQGCGCGC